MRTLGLLLSSLVIAAACGGGDDDTPPPDATVDATPPDASPPDTPPPPPDAAPPPDAHVPDFSCAGDPPIRTAPASLNFAGSVSDILLMSAIADVTVEARLRLDDSILATDTTDAGGAFAMTLPNPAMTPLDSYVRFSKTGYNDTYVFPPDPIAADVDMFNAIATNMLALLYSFTTPTPPAYDPAAGTAIILVVDCAGFPISGATVGFTPAPVAVGYLAGMAPSTGAAGTDTSGVGIGYAVPVGNVTVTADYMGQSLESHTFASYANSLSVTIIHP